MKHWKIPLCVIATMTASTLFAENLVFNVTEDNKSYTPYSGTIEGSLTLNVNALTPETDGVNPANVTFGGALTLVNGGSITNSGATAVELNFNSGAVRNYIQGATSGAMITGDIVMNILDGSFNNQTSSSAITEALVGTAYGDQKSTVINGNTEITIDDGYFAGNVFAGGGATLNGDAVLQINGGIFTKVLDKTDGVFGGNSWGGIINGDTYLIISGGTFDIGVFGGNHRTASAFTQNTIHGSSYVEIDGGTFQDICGGGTNGQRIIIMLRTPGLIEGDTSVLIRGGNIFGNISAAGGTVNGDASVTFVGNASDLNFSGIVAAKRSDTGNTPNENVATVIGGTSTIYFGTEDEPFIGTFNGQVKNFDRMVIAAGSNVTFTKQPVGVGEIIGNAVFPTSEASYIEEKNDIADVIDAMDVYDEEFNSEFDSELEVEY